VVFRIRIFLVLPDPHPDPDPDPDPDPFLFVIKVQNVTDSEHCNFSNTLNNKLFCKLSKNNKTKNQKEGVYS
jgi:hypothetical protein